MIWHHSWTIFLTGFAGGTFINIYRLYAVVHLPSVERPAFDGIYWAQFIGLAVAGGIVAVCHNSINPINALVALNVGVSIPALLKTGATEIQQKKKAPGKRNIN